jgi:hypothetical protein
MQPFGSSQHFIEPEGSLLSLQELSACTYPEPNQDIHLTGDKISTLHKISKKESYKFIP